MRYFRIILFGIFGCSNSDAALTALTDSPFAWKLYQELRNTAEPSAADLAASSAQIRKEICKEITDNEYFHQDAQLAFDEEEFLLREFNNPVQYGNVLNQIYDIDSYEDFVEYEYTNPYRRRQFRLLSQVFEEYVFLCLGTRLNEPREIFFYYVSKEYNVGPTAGDKLAYRSGRFVFTIWDPEPVPHELNVLSYIMLAEEPATVHQSAGFNVELHYLRTRKYVQETERDQQVKNHPLCKLISDDEDDVENQHHRFCVSISRSSAYMNMTLHPENETHLCVRKEVSFRTEDGMRRAPTKPYYEWVVPCYVEIPGGDHFLYISRAYTSNQVFVFRQSVLHEKLFLENLSGNLSILDELNSFDFIED